MIDDILSIIPELYNTAERFFKRSFFFRQDILKFFPNKESANYFRHKLNNLQLVPYAEWFDQPETGDILNLHHGGIKIHPAYRLDSAKFIETVRQFLRENDLLIEERLDYEKLHIHPNEVSYQHIRANRIIFCEGYKLIHNPWHHHLPLHANKGEYLIVSIPGFPENYTIQAGISIVPIGNALFWVGSDYQLQFENELPTPAKRMEYEIRLRQLLKVNFKVIAHGAGIRPTVSNERRPFVGCYPPGSPIALLNGLGAKGASYAPYFAHQLVNHLLDGHPLHNEADVTRFAFPHQPS